MRKKITVRKTTPRKPKPRKLSSAKQRKKSRIATIFKSVFFVLLSLIGIVLAGYFFVLPSIISRTVVEKNIVIVSSKLDAPNKNIYLAHISGLEQKNIIYSIDAQLSVVVPGGYGEYPLQSVYQLLLIDKKDSQFIRSIYSQLFSIPIDEVVVVDEVLDDLNESDFSALFLSKNVKNLDLHYLTKNISLIDVGSFENVAKYSHDFATVKGDVFQYCSVAVVNATGVNGVARELGDIIEQSGALVVRVDDIKNLQKETKIYFGSDPVDCGQLAQTISGIFSQKPEFLPLEKLENAQQYRAQVVVIVGENSSL